MRTKSLLAPALTMVVVLGAAACGDDDDDDATTTTTEATTTTSSDSTTTAPSDDLASGPNYETTSGPSGAGCTPGEVTTLPKGWWAGQIKQVHESGIDLDLVCWFQGDAATKAAEEDGQIATDDYYVRDEDPRTFRIDWPLGMNAATCAGDDNQPFACQVGDVLGLYQLSLADPSTPTSMLGDTTLTAFPYVWVHTNDSGGGDYLYMQFTP